MKKLKTIDQFCGCPPGSFAKFIAKQEEKLKKEEEERKVRVRAARK